MGFKFFGALAVAVLSVPVFASQFALLEPGQHLGVQPGFNVEPSRDVLEAMEQKLDSAREAGMDVVPINVEWPALEPEPGQYDKDALREEFAEAQHKQMKILALLPLIDADGLPIPEYLANGRDLTDFNGIDFESPEILDRYKLLLDWVVPMLTEYGGFGIIVGIEPDNHLEVFPEKTDAVVNVLRTVRDHVHSINPDMAVAMAISNAFDNETYSIRLMNEGDFLSFNFYCDHESSNVDRAEMEAALTKRLQHAGDKPALIQELGCSSVIEGGAEMLDRQQEWFQVFFGLMAERPQLQVAMVFQLVDWDERTLELYNEYLRPLFVAEGGEAHADRVLSALAIGHGSIGLLRTDGTEKPAWGTFLKALSGSISTPTNLRRDDDP